MAAIKAGLDGHIDALSGVRGVGKQQHVASQHVFSCWNHKKRGHAYRLHYLLRCRMRLPGLSHIESKLDHTAGPAVITHVQHQNSGADFRHLGLCSSGLGACSHGPGFAVVFAVHYG